MNVHVHLYSTYRFAYSLPQVGDGMHPAGLCLPVHLLKTLQDQYLGEIKLGMQYGLGLRTFNQQAGS
jgi:hypothetical protein